MIQAAHLCKTYVLRERNGLFRKKTRKEIPAVKDISLEIPRGSITGVLGINGAGKTTTIRMLASLISPTSGTLTMDGMDAVKNHLQVKKRINVITGGERNLYWRLTARENLRYFGNLYGLSGKELEQRIDRLLRAVGLTEAQNIPVERYSKGMKQRLQIARGLINDPEYLFLDEPTLGLDILIAREIRELIRQLAKEQNKGVLLTTHYIREAEELCDSIYLLEKGEIIAQGTKEELAELFQYKPRLAVQTDLPADSPVWEALRQRFPENVQVSPDQPSAFQVEGNAQVWSQVLNLLLEHQVPVEKLNIQEANLEEVLTGILRRSREEKA